MKFHIEVKFTEILKVMARSRRICLFGLLIVVLLFIYGVLDLRPALLDRFV